MSDATDTPGSGIGLTIIEVQGIFPSDTTLQKAVARLTQSGFDRADLSLPEATPSIATATPEQGASAVTTDTDIRQVRTMATSMAGAVGALAAAGAVIATGGAAAIVIAAAAAAGGGAALLANAGGNAAEAVQHAGREDSAARGELVLSARAATPERQAEAMALMRGAGASEVMTVQLETAAITRPPSRG